MLPMSALLAALTLVQVPTPTEVTVTLVRWPFT
jgi:hypothetical protein